MNYPTNHGTFCLLLKNLTLSLPCLNRDSNASSLDKNTIIWGHVFDGNVHFVLTPDFGDTAESARD